jgi:hypothetical protein
MTTQKEVVTAFPCHGPSGQVFQYGMSLRDWLAGMALQGLLSNQRYAFDQGHMQHGAALDSYSFADAMLAARKEDA